MNRARQSRVPGLVSLMLVLILALASAADAAPLSAGGASATSSPGGHAKRQLAPSLHQVSSDASHLNIPARQTASNSPALAVSTFSVNYLPAGTKFYSWTCQTWPAEAITAFNAAAAIWGSLLKSSVPITVDACWATLAQGDYSGGWPSGYTGGPGSDLWPDNPDIEAVFGSGGSWYFGTTGTPGPGQYDFVTNVLRELGYGLGYESSLGVANGLGSWGFGWSPTMPNVYDRFVVNSSGKSLIGGFPNKSTALAAQLQSNDVYFDGPQAKSANAGNRPKLYSPSPWQKIAYISYLDPVYDGTANALMTLTLATQEVVHDPGPMGLAVLNDLGWVSAPTVTGFKPASGNPGASISITGTNLTGVSNVSFDGMSAGYMNFSAAEIIATVPAYISGQVSVTVTTSDGTATSPMSFTVAGVANPQVNFLSTPARIVDTRPGSGYEGAGQPMQGYSTPRRFMIAGQGGIPANASAVIANVTAVGYPADGWIAAWPACAAWSGTSSVNFDTDENAIANFAVIKLSPGVKGYDCLGTIDVMGAPGTNVIVDAVGYVVGTTDDQIVLLDYPKRAVDTRAGSGKQGAGTPIPANPSSSRFALANVEIPYTATAILANITAVGYSKDGWVAAWPACTTWPGTSNLNFDTVENAIANFAVIKLGDSSGGAGCLGAIDVTASSSTNFIVDVVGYLVATPADQVTLLPSPQRFVDTRLGYGGQLQGGVARCFQVAGQGGVPADAQGVVLNLTAVGYTKDGWIAAYPNGEAWSGTSSVNFDTQESAIANTAVVRPGTGGQVCLLASSNTHAIIDVSGYLR